MQLLLAVLIVCVLVFVYTCAGTDSYSEKLRNRITFLSAHETRDLILADRDEYISRMSPADMIARGLPGSADPMRYAQRSANAALNFTKSERDNISELAHALDAQLAGAPSPGLISLLGSRENVRRLAGLPWVFAKTTGRLYEEGMPHVRDGVIFLSEHVMPFLDISTLLHEKVHAFTGAYPDLTEDILTSHGFHRIRRTRGRFARINPDTSENAYFNVHLGGSFDGSAYHNAQPPSINYTDRSPPMEHPYEWLAYESEKYIF